MELVLKGLQWKTLLIYLDDIIILSSTFTDHVQRLDEVLTRLGNAGLKLKPSKCHLFRDEVFFLGHTITTDGVKPDPSKVSVVQNWPPLRTLQKYVHSLHYVLIIVVSSRSFQRLPAP